MKKKLLIVGYYGWGNFGDELFRLVARQQSRLLFGENVTVRDFTFPLSSLRCGNNVFGKAIRFFEMIIGGTWADNIVYFGGSVFSKIELNTYLRDKLFCKKKRTMALGVSVGPFVNYKEKESVESVLKNIDYVIVRDKASLNRSDTPMTLAGDLAALFPYTVVSDTDKIYGLTICPSAASGMDMNIFLKKVMELLPKNYYETINILALNTGNKGDIKVCDFVFEGLKRSGFNVTRNYFTSVKETVNIIASSKSVWSQRLHAVIVGYLSDVPVLAFSHHEKIIDFCREIKLDEQYCFDLENFNSDNILAATKSLQGKKGWSVAPSEYISLTKKRYQAK